MCSGSCTPRRACASGTVCGVSTPDPKSLDQMFNTVLHTEDDALRAAREAGVAAGMPAIEVSAQHGKLLALLAMVTHASRVLEIGTLAGYSTINLARGVGPGGRVVTLEFAPKHAEVARKNFERAGVADRVEVIVGAALDTLPTLADRGEPFDLIFIDADKENNVAYVEWAMKLGAPGSVIVVDNIARMRPGAGPRGRRPSGPRRARHARDDGRAPAIGRRRRFRRSAPRTGTASRWPSSRNRPTLKFMPFIARRTAVRSRGSACSRARRAACPRGRIRR